MCCGVTQIIRAKSPIPAARRVVDKSQPPDPCNSKAPLPQTASSGQGPPAFVEFLKSTARNMVFKKWGGDARPAPVGNAELFLALSASDQATVEQRFVLLDTNHNGLVAWEEATLSGAGDFDTMDKNNDRRITKAGFLATHQSTFM